MMIKKTDIQQRVSIWKKRSFYAFSGMSVARLSVSKNWRND